jgi:hypothetical protein
MIDATGFMQQRLTQFLQTWRSPEIRHVFQLVEWVSIGIALATDACLGVI